MLIAEVLLGRSLPDELRAFYQANDGVFLAWGLRGSHYSDLPSAFGLPGLNTPPGLINLLPLAHVFTPSWVDTGCINWPDVDYRALFGVEECSGDWERLRAVVIDNYEQFHHADLVFGPIEQLPWVVMASDHGADMCSANWLRFATYLDVILAQWGTARYGAVGPFGGNKPGVLSAPPDRPTLAQLIAASEADER